MSDKPRPIYMTDGLVLYRNYQPVLMFTHTTTLGGKFWESSLTSDEFDQFVRHITKLLNEAAGT